MSAEVSVNVPEDGVLERWFSRLNPAYLDRGEQIVIALMWLWLLQRIAESHNEYGPLILMCETIVVIFTLFRRPTTNISMRLGDWLLAFTATAAPLLIQPTDMLHPDLAPLAVGLVLLGNVIQGAAKISLRRSFGIAPANRGIKAHGVYSFVRHPMYAGYLVVHIGVLTLMPSVLNFVAYGICWFAQVLRLLAEEELLSKDPAYVAFKEKVRYRLIPGIF